MNAIKIRPTVMDIPFIDDEGKEVLRLHFDRSDENVNRFYGIIPEMESKIKEIEAEPEKEFDEKAFLREIADSFLGDGAFDKIYEINRSTFITAKYIYQIALGLKKEMEDEDIRAVFDKYK